MKRLTIDLPRDLHKQFRRVCLERETDMATEMRRLIAGLCDESRKDV